MADTTDIQIEHVGSDTFRITPISERGVLWMNQNAGGSGSYIHQDAIETRIIVRNATAMGLKVRVL